MARIAARHAFVELKLHFEQAVAGVPGAHGTWLRHQVRSAEEPTDLWLLRAPVFAAVAGGGLEDRGHRQVLRRNLEALFPDSAPTSAFALL